MAEIRDLMIGTQVLVSLGDSMHKGVIVEPRPDHQSGEGMVCVKFTPPVPDPKMANRWTNYLTCKADRVELAGVDPTD